MAKILVDDITSHAEPFVVSLSVGAYFGSGLSSFLH